MPNQSLTSRAAEPMLVIVRGIKPDQLTARTPDTEWDVRALVNHLLIWGPSLEGGARKESVAPPPLDTDYTDGDWMTLLATQIERTATAWNDPAVWEGTTHMGRPFELPARIVGDMVLGEFLVHGWDLARATGQDVEWPDDVVTATYDGVAGFAELGRQIGLFGTAVDVPSTASAFDRLLAITGRDPAWHA